jgi:hypothetical protein
MAQGDDFSELKRLGPGEACFATYEDMTRVRVPADG